jgi:hypothetical protein
MNPQEALQRIIDHREIFHDEMVALMRLIMRGEVSDVMIAAILTGLRVKKETIGEITGAAQVMREFAVKVPTPPGVGLVDRRIIIATLPIGIGHDRLPAYFVKGDILRAVSCGRGNDDRRLHAVGE